MNKRQINYDNDRDITAQRLKEAMDDAQYAETMQKANRDKMERLYFGKREVPKDKEVGSGK